MNYINLKHIIFMILAFAFLFSCEPNNNNGVDEICANGLDDDLDGAIDCEDNDCREEPVCIEAKNCEDGIDNDLDNEIDCTDLDCAEDTFCPRVINGFSAPESVLFDPGSNAWYVSNLGQLGVPGDGFLSKLDAAGNPIDFAFVPDLFDPKGFRILNGKLFLADITGVLVIDVKTGTLLETIEIPGAILLNDVAIDPTTEDVYISDTFANTIFRLIGGVTPEVFLQDAGLEAPNGLLFEENTLLVASVGPDINPDTFQTSAPGRIFSIDIYKKSFVAISDRIGALDGLERDGQNLLTTDFTGLLFQIDTNNTLIELLNGTDGTLLGSADLGFDPQRRLVAIPELFGTEVSFFDLDNPEFE